MYLSRSALRDARPLSASRIRLQCGERLSIYLRWWAYSAGFRLYPRDRHAEGSPHSMAHGVISAGRKASWYASFDVVLPLLGRYPSSLFAKWVLDNRRRMVPLDGKIHKDYGDQAILPLTLLRHTWLHGWLNAKLSHRSRSVSTPVRDSA
jgi:hypothetical protein